MAQKRQSTIHSFFNRAKNCFIERPRRCRLLKIVVVAVCIYLHEKEQLIIIENKIDQRLQIGIRQLNYTRYNMYKKNCAWSPHQLCKKRVTIVFHVHIVVFNVHNNISFACTVILCFNFSSVSV